MYSFIVKNLSVYNLSSMRDDAHCGWTEREGSLECPKRHVSYHVVIARRGRLVTARIGLGETVSLHPVRSHLAHPHASPCTVTPQYLAGVLARRPRTGIGYSLLLLVVVSCTHLVSRAPNAVHECYQSYPHPHLQFIHTYGRGCGCHVDMNESMGAQRY